MANRGGLSRGFTIVELLIVIVIIGILAAIVIVAYNGIQNKAYDAAVKADIEGLGKQISMYYVQTGAWPYLVGQIAFNPAISIKVTKNAYSLVGLSANGTNYNLVVCWPTAATSSTGYAIIAQSQSGNVFENKNGAIDQASYAFGFSATMCAAAGITMDTSQPSDGGRDWLYVGNAGGWQAQVDNS